MGPKTISIVAPAAIALAVVLTATRAGAAPATATVPALASAPSLDPQAPPADWPAGPPLALTWDVVHAGPAGEPAIVHVASDGRFLYVRFDVTQRGPAIASQHSNDTITGGSQNNGALSWGSDDAVWVDLWPTGATGFEYQFEANPNGSHNESSTENAGFSPHWESRGAVHDGGYTVTMAIPFNVLHGARSGSWRAQFIRYTRATGAQIVWSFDPAQTSADDASHAGTLTLTVSAAATRATPRAAVYALGSIAAASAGGSTSRVGADLSIPVTPTAAVFAALHPDYSNVELDQQTIAPSVYQRQISEVRPFFTQAASFYNTFNCNVCVGYHTTLYTPAIPTFAQGYAFEGKRGEFGLAAFDAIAGGRNDAAAALDYTSPDTNWHGAFQHVSTSLPGLIDQTNEFGFNYSDRKRWDAYANYSLENGTLVPNPGQGTAFDGGAGYATPHFALFGSVRTVGPNFNPVDGYVQHPGIAGYAVYGSRIWDFAPSSVLASIGISGSLDRFQGPMYGLAQSDNQIVFDVLTKSAWDLQLYTGSDYWRFGTELQPVSQAGGFQITYHSGTQTDNPNNFPNHGSSATPSMISYSTGAYGAGRLDTWLRTAVIRAGDKGTVSITVDDTAQWFTSGPNNIQWFDALAYSYQINRESSFAVGLRSVSGYAPQPNGGGNCAGKCTNVSIAYHLRLKNAEFYIAYGNPNALTTVPQAILKVIFYLGGQKGT